MIDKIIGKLFDKQKKIFLSTVLLNIEMLLEKAGEEYGQNHLELSLSLEKKEGIANAIFYDKEKKALGFFDGGKYLNDMLQRQLEVIPMAMRTAILGKGETEFLAIPPILEKLEHQSIEVGFDADCDLVFHLITDKKTLPLDLDDFVENISFNDYKK